MINLGGLFWITPQTMIQQWRNFLNQFRLIHEKRDWDVQGIWSILLQILFWIDKIHPSCNVNLGKISQTYPDLSYRDKKDRWENFTIWSFISLDQLEGLLSLQNVKKIT